MNALLGQILVLVALAGAAAGSVLGYASGVRRSLLALRWAERATYLFAAAIVGANLVMVRALVQHDFSVSYVARTGSRATPLIFSVVSLWSSLEGSILFWGAILGGFTAAFAFANRHHYRDHMGYALGTLLAVSIFFALLIAGPAHPFRLVSPVPADGPGPNPLLQNHILMVVHPPTLYLGYVGMTVPFAIAVATLLRGHLSEGWMAVLRRWMLVAWLFLSIGIIMGGWWAYEVLGWGGYWAWDPVENASLMPWLATTAYLHSAAVQQRRGVLRAWTLSLVLGAFMLTILGTFMTRSGVFNSVHSFTQSSIGPMFLAFLAVVLVASLALAAGRGHLLDAEGRIQALLSREMSLLLGSLVFVVFTFTVLVGTVFPLVTEVVRGSKVSVGEPYFDRMAIPLGLLLVLLMGLSSALPWGKPRLGPLPRSLALPLAAGLAVAVICAVAGLRQPVTVLTFALSAFAAASTLRELLGPALRRARRRRVGVVAALQHTLRVSPRRTGGYVTHLAVLMVVVAIAASQTYKRTVEASLTPGDTVTLGPYTLKLERVGAYDEPHRFVVVAEIWLSEGGRALGLLSPRLNYYRSQREPIGSPHVETVRGRDVYVSLMSVDKNGGRVGIKVFVVPMVAWIWWSLPVLVLGALIALWPRRQASLAVPDGATVQVS